MRFTLDRATHLNTNISDERGNVLYNIATPHAFFSPVTTIKKYHPTPQGWVEQTMATIEWPRLFHKALFRFNGNEIPVDQMFETRMWSKGLRFLGPDQRTYKWKVSPRLLMKIADSTIELVRYHPKNLGLNKTAHPAFLDVSPDVVSMLDLIILTFVYAESKREQLKRQRRAQGKAAGHLVGHVVTALV